MRKSHILAVVVATALVLIPSSARSSVSADPASRSLASVPRYDDRTVFRGLMFGHGPVAEALPEYYSHVPSSTPEILRVEDQIMDDLERQSPGTIAALSAAIRSGSHIRTLATLDNAHAAMQQLVGSNQKNIQSDEEIAALLPVVVVAIVYVATYIYKYHEITESEQGSLASRLQREQLVHRVIVTLSR